MGRLLAAHDPRINKLRRNPRVRVMPRREGGVTTGWWVIPETCNVIQGNTGNLS